MAKSITYKITNTLDGYYKITKRGKTIDQGLTKEQAENMVDRLIEKAIAELKAK